MIKREFNKSILQESGMEPGAGVQQIERSDYGYGTTSTTTGTTPIRSSAIRVWEKASRMDGKERPVSRCGGKSFVCGSSDAFALAQRGSDPYEVDRSSGRTTPQNTDFVTRCHARRGITPGVISRKMKKAISYKCRIVLWPGDFVTQRLKASYYILLLYFQRALREV